MDDFALVLNHKCIQTGQHAGAHPNDFSSERSRSPLKLRESEFMGFHHDRVI